MTIDSRPSGGSRRLALISDIHGNLPALEGVLADIDSRGGVDLIYHIGDLVGYGASPNEVVALLHDRGIAGVAGNYDSTVALDYIHCGCRYENPLQEAQAHESFEWTRANVTPETKRRLAQLPFRVDVRPFGGHLSGPMVTLIHGAATLNTLYWTADRTDTFCREMAERIRAKAGDVIAFGHTHLSWHRTIDGIDFVNAGSVGRPKDGDPRAGYVVMTMSPGLPATVEFRRIDYDVERAATSILATSLPAAFAEFLRRGG
ncbi:MAG TPA: metallophosphoesterase family protein [Gemmatimonadales bacterium]|jgi:predicted phosphodiesterase